VSDAEVDNFLATTAAQSGGDTEYRLAHVLVIVPELSSPEQIDAKRRRAEDALKQIRSGAEFSQVAAGFSDAPDALKGGDLGWRVPARLPTVFAEQVRNMKPGEVSEVLRSPTGFHIVKVEEIRSRNQPTVVEQTHARHILIKVNEITSESEAKIKIDRVKDRLDGGASFEDQARLNSEDASSSNGGDLGWISPGDTVPDFEQAMAKLKPGEVSAPVRSPFGWHLIQVLERRTQDVTAERQREQARQAMRLRKSEEAFQEWVRQIRDRAYVEFKANER
jgi:peptidyl-prolyl cis-trans isomerase SurA